MRIVTAWIAVVGLAATAGCNTRVVGQPITNTTGGGGTGSASDTTSATQSGSGGTEGATTSSTSAPPPCVTPADCPGAETDCAARTCTGGVCGMVFTPVGTPAGSQVTGDCHLVICDGAGNAVSVIDDADPPIDGNACTLEFCQSGSSFRNDVPAGTICGSGAICDGAGNCVGCLIDADCGAPTPCATPRCVAGACSAEHAPAGTGDPGGQVSGDCQRAVCDGHGGVTTVADDADLPADDANPCTVEACAAGAPQHLPAGAGVSCGAGLWCNGASCIAGCVIGGVKVASGATDPADACRVCDPSRSTSAWSSAADGAACDDGQACTTNDRCYQGVCAGKPYACPSACATGATCDGHGGCIGGTTAADGAHCTTDGATWPYAPGLAGGCHAGACWNACWVNGTYYFPGGSLLDTAVCQYCDIAVSTTSLYNGSCHSGGYFGTCDGQGVCWMGSCGECRNCGVTACGGGHCYGYPLPNGTPCSGNRQCSDGFCI
jgi:hypothetical protein